MVSTTRTITFGVCTSIVLHALGLLMVRSLTVLPDFGFELALPDEVELGIYDGAHESAPATPAEPQPPSASEGEQNPQPPNAESTAPVRKKPPEVRHEPAANSPEPTKPAAKSGALANFSPRGAQLALRLDLDRVRDSALSEDVGTLLATLPDVRLLLEGSGVVPMRDLSRLFLASPDLRRSHVVMAGRYRGDETLPRNAVESLAQARGTTAPWRRLRGIAVAPWQNADTTARVLALVGPGLFAITREEDLMRVLAVARALARRKQLGTISDAAAAQALVSMGDQELLGLSVENAKSFIRGPRAEQAPDRLELSVRQTSPEAIEVDAQAQFTSAEQAQAAARFWTEARDRYAAHPLVALIGMDSVLRDSTLALHDLQIDAHSTLPVSRARLLLGFLRDALNRPMPALSSARQDDAPAQ
jgi:hypothetical protein